MALVIRYGHARCTLVKGHSKHFLSALRFRDPSARFTREYQEGLSDGKVLFYDRITRSFPTGFLDRVVKKIKDKGKKVRVEYPDGMEPVSLKGLDRDMLFDFTLRKYQHEAVIEAVRRERGWIWHATNAGKSAEMAALALHLKRKIGAKTLVIVPNKGLMHTTAKTLQSLCGGEVKVGMVGDGIRGRGDVIVATAQTIIRGCPLYVEQFNYRVARNSSPFQRRKKRRAKKIKLDRNIHRLLASVDCLIVDEGHHASADTWRAILNACENARFRIGMTGTMKTKQRIRDITLKAYVGPLLHRVTNDQLIEKGYSAKPIVYAIRDKDLYARDLTVPKKRVSYKDRRTGEWVTRWLPEGRERHRLELKALLSDADYNAAVVRVARAFLRSGLKPLILTTSLAQLNNLKRRVEAKGLHPLSIWGDVDGKRRSTLVKRFSADENAVLMGSTVFDEGFNAPAVGVLLLVAQGKSTVKLLQRVGRAIRAKSKGLNLVAVVDFTATNGEYLLKHSAERLATYRAEKFEVERVTDLDEFCERARGGWRGLLGDKRYERERRVRSAA